MTRRIEESDGFAVPGDLVGTDVLGDTTGLARRDVRLTDFVQQQGLAVVDVAHHGNDRRTRRHGDDFVVILFVEELGEKLGLFLLTGIDEMDFSADFGGVELDHVVRETLHGGDDLPLEKQETNDVRGTAIELRSHVLGRGTSLDDDLTFRDRRTARLPGRHLGRLEFFDVAPTPTSDLAL